MGRRGERLSGAWDPPRWQRPWHAPLLAASILGSCFLWTQAQVGVSLEKLVKAEPSKPIEGENVTLTPEKPSAGLLSCLWYRGFRTETENLIFSDQMSREGQTNGKAYTGRETSGPGCSLHIRNLTFKDSGTYTVTMNGLQAVETRRVHIEVSGVCTQNEKSSSQGISTCVYENMPFFPKRRPWAEAERPFLPRHTYEALSHGDEAVYDDLKW